MKDNVNVALKATTTLNKNDDTIVCIMICTYAQRTVVSTENVMLPVIITAYTRSMNDVSGASESFVWI